MLSDEESELGDKQHNVNELVELIHQFGRELRVDDRREEQLGDRVMGNPEEDRERLREVQSLRLQLVYPIRCSSGLFFIFIIFCLSPHSRSS